MHHEAELGIAAHWAYKEQRRPFKRNVAWIQQLREWQRAADTEEFLESLKIDFFKDRIFVFTPKGDVIDLPDGATPVDFAYAVHSELGDHCMLAKVNGKAVELRTALKNNDMVEIAIQRNKKPSADWLTFVKTSKARSKIRDALRRENEIKR
jgi:GTP pyrophosphokinase